MIIRNATFKDLNRLDAFSSIYDRPNSTTFKPEFYNWQFEEASKLVESEDNGFLIGEQDGAIVSMAYGSKVPIWIDGKSVEGLWQQSWYAGEGHFGSGYFLMKEQMRRNPFVGASGQNYNAASINELMRPMVWFELTRMYVVINVEETFRLLFDSSEHAGRFLSTKKIKLSSKSSKARLIDHFDADYDHVWEKVRRLLLLASDRTSRYMNWRYINHPVFTYQCLEVATDDGNAYFIWREEPVADSGIVVARICEVIGDPRAITSACTDFFVVIAERKMAFADFFCSHAETNSALFAGGMRPVITTDEFDLPRLFQPVFRDARKTINFYYSFSGSDRLPDFYDYHRTYITKGDGNQDRPNP